MAIKQLQAQTRLTSQDESFLGLPFFQNPSPSLYKQPHKFPPQPFRFCRSSPWEKGQIRDKEMASLPGEPLHSVQVTQTTLTIIPASKEPQPSIG